MVIWELQGKPKKSFFFIFKHILFEILFFRLNMAHYEDAIGYFEQQLATLERLSTPTAQLDKGRAFGSLGDCYDALGDPEEAVKCHEQYLAIASKLKSLRDQER